MTSGNLNITKIANNRDIRQAINRQLKEIVENDGYFTGWIDGKVKLERFSTEIRSCWKISIYQTFALVVFTKRQTFYICIVYNKPFVHCLHQGRRIVTISAVHVVQTRIKLLLKNLIME